MRIVHVANYFIPHSGYQEPYLARHQVELGHDVHVVTSNRAYPKQGDYAGLADVHPSRVLPAGTTELDGYRVHRLEAVLETNMQLLLRGVLKKLREIDPDVVFAHGFSRYETLRLALWKKVFSRRFALIVDDHMLYSVHSRTWYRRGYHALVRWLVHRADLLDEIDRVVPVSSETESYLHEHFGLPASKLTMIPLGAECDRFVRDASARADVRQRLGIPADAVVILYAGKMTREKGLDLLYEASRRLLERRERAHLLLVGSGGDAPFARELREAATSDGVAEKMHWCGHVTHDELATYYAAADLAVWPRQETMAALEAASASLPIVLRDSPVSRERTAGGNGMNCSTVEELESAIGRLLDDDPLRREMGLRGAEFVRAQFDWPLLARRFVELAVACGANGSPPAERSAAADRVGSHAPQSVSAT